MKWFLLNLMIQAQGLIADHTIFNAEAGRGNIVINSTQTARLVNLFREISQLAIPTNQAIATTCGYIFSGDPNKFGCQSTGVGAADVAMACQKGGLLTCNGYGAGQTCTCAFD